jgi:hypothetical protein
MSGNFINRNPSSYEGKLIEETQNLKDLVKELLSFINRNGLEFYNEHDIEELLIKTGIQCGHE